MKRDVKGIDPIRSIERAIKVVDCFSYETDTASKDNGVQDSLDTGKKRPDSI